MAAQDAAGEELDGVPMEAGDDLDGVAMDGADEDDLDGVPLS
jgi:hypothetical protein